MSNQEAKAPVPFSVMNGDPELFIAQGKKYNVSPMKIADAVDFSDDNLSVGSQIFNIAVKENREQVNGYLSKYCTKENGDSMTLEIAMADDWDIVDLKKFIRKLCDISG